MKHLKRALSMLLVTLMIVTMLPADLISTAFATVTEPTKQSEAGASETNSTGETNQESYDTDLTIDFDYEEREGIINANQALLNLAKDPEVFERKQIQESQIQSEYSKYLWKHVDSWTVTDHDEGSIREALVSTDPAFDYVVLDCDINRSYYKNAVWEPMVISRDKVLDLNGYSLNIRYDSNRGNDDPNQTTHQEYHNCVAFKITQGATLTIIDSSAWRKEGTDGKGKGAIKFTGYMVNPYSYDITSYTTRDMFYVDDGNLIVYGGTFQAGRKKDQLKSNFSWKKLRTVIGNAVELGVNVAEYATGIGIASAAYTDLLQQETNMDAFDDGSSSSKYDDGTDGGSQTMMDRDGKNLNAKKSDTMLDTATESKDNPGSGREQTVEERKVETDATYNSGSRPGTPDGENKATADGKSKDDTQTALAKAQKDVVDKVVNKSAIGNMVDGAFDLVDGIIGMCGKDEKSRVTQSIKGTVVRVGGNGCFVAYGGTFMGYGCTPNTRNATVEVVKLDGKKDWDGRKSQGGVVYIYDGLFEAYNGANVFNMIKITQAPQYAHQVVKDIYGNVLPEEYKQLKTSETGGVEVLYFDNQDELPTDQAARDAFVAIPVNTANVQVRGGTFRCFYDMMNVAIREDEDPEDDDNHFRKFPGTPGCVNLGVESFGENLIRDGRIQIVDNYGAGALVLLDDRSEEKAAVEAAGGTFTESLYHYRLFCGDSELRSKYYLSVYPNTAKTNSAYSMQLATYYGTGKKSAELWTNDKDNIRAASRQTENYFDFIFDDPDNSDSWSVMLNFYHPGDNTNNYVASMDPYGQFLKDSEVWYYPTPLDADGDPLPDTAYGTVYYTAPMKSDPNQQVCVYQQTWAEDYWDYNRISNWADVSRIKFHVETHQAVRTSMKYFTYKVYRVDPLTRENINENGVYGADDPLIQVRYGAGEDSLKCKLPLLQVAEKIKEKRPDWQGYRAGEMYRIELEVEEYVANGYRGGSLFGQKLTPAKSEATILFRCVSLKDRVSVGGAYEEYQFSALQLLAPRITAGYNAYVQLRNGRAGMTDYWGDNKIFDVYYQWWEVDADGNDIRMLAGTDNIWNNDDLSGKPLHNPKGWDVINDTTHTYVNTVDPNDPNAASYGYHGLPGTATVPDKDNWTPEMIHMYSRDNTSKERYKARENENLCLENNNVFATNWDKCYIPEDMLGHYIQIRAIVLNYKWPAAFDKKQTFKSRVYQVQKLPGTTTHEEILYPLTGAAMTVRPEYPDVRKAYATSQQPAAIRVRRMQNLGENEKITEIYYTVGDRCKSYTGLSTTTMSELPMPLYPNDFYPSDYDLTALPAKQLEVKVQWKTSYGRTCQADPYEDGALTLNFEVEATGYVGGGTTYTLTAAEAKDMSGTIRPFQPNVPNATRGVNYQKDSSSTDRYIAWLDSDGCLRIPGALGSATVSITGKDGHTCSVEVNVIRSFNRIEISCIEGPKQGHTLFQRHIRTGTDGYEITNVEWYQGDELLDDDYLVERWKAYTIDVTVEVTEGYFDFAHGTYYLGGWNTDDSWFHDEGNCADEDGKALQTGPNEFHFRHTFPGIGSDDPVARITQVYVEYPKLVLEGVSWDKWAAEDLHIYSDGYDERYSITAYPTYAADAANILQTFGDFDLSTDMTGDAHACFIPGVQNGVAVDIELDPEHYQDVFDSGVKVYVNGAEQTSFLISDEHRIMFFVPDSLTVVDREEYLYEMPPVYPTRSLLKSRERQGADYFFTSSDTRTTFSFTGTPRPANSQTTQEEVDSYIDYRADWDNLLCWLTSSNDAYDHFAAEIDVLAKFDQDSDGYPELVEKYTLVIDKSLIYEGDGNPPAPDPVALTFRYVDLDGNILQTQNVSYTGGVLRLPPVAEYFCCGVWQNGMNRGLLTRYGLGALSVPPAGTYDVLFTPVEGSVTVTPGATEIFISARDTDGDDLPCMQYSLDGEHYTTSNYIGGLEPDTDYMLYVRQGTNAWYYTQLFHTAAVDYGVRVGHVPVTDKNLGNLDMLGWEFDPDSRTLYLDRLWWRDTGTPCSSEQVFYVEATARALIYSSGDLTVHLFGDWGDTTLERIPEAGDWFSNYTVYAEGDLTIRGSGSLVINGDNTADFAFGSGSGDITLNLGGTLTVNCGTGFYVPNGQLIYRSGDIAFNSYVRTVGYNDLQVCNFIPRDQLSSFKLYPEHGTMRYEVAGLDGVRTEVDEDGLLEQLDANYEAWQTKRSVYITPTHTYDQQVSTMEYWEDGECGGSVTYHYSCCCGASGAETYTVNQAEHDLVHCAGDPPTCEHGGYYDYDRCTKCAYYGTFHYYSQGLGHDWTHYDPEWPTCTEDGHPAYEVCQRCGASTAVELPTDEELALGLGDTGLATWKATGHTYRYVGAQNATCTQDGHPACYVCDSCGEYFAHQDDVVPMDPAEVVIPAAGHSWGFPEVTPATPTANGARTARCLLCGEAGETTVIPRIDWIELSDYTCYYDGTPKEPAVTVYDYNDDTDESNEIPPTFYTVTYSDNIEGPVATVTVEFSGDYSGVMTEHFNIPKCGDTVWYALPDGSTVMHILGQGATYDYAYKESPFYNMRSHIGSLVVEDGITYLGKDIFDHLIESTVTLADSVTEIGNSAFWNNNRLVTVDLGSGVERIGQNAFRSCQALPAITFPASLQQIGKEAFKGSYMIKEITFLGSAPTIGENAFQQITATVYYPAGDPTWTAAVRQDYGGTLTWVSVGGPTITAQPTDYTGPLDSMASFHVEATGTGLTYQWQYKSLKDGKWYNASAEGNKTDTLTIKATNARNGMLFRCKLTDGAGIELISDEAALHVAEPLAITTQPTDFTGPVGATATFHVAATGTGLTYQWQYKSAKDGKWYNASATGAKTDTMSIEVTNARDGLQFRCKITDATGDVVYSGTATLHVQTAEPLAITTQPTDFTGPVGATATFHVEATGTGLTYQWQYKSAKDGKWYNTSATGYNTDTMSIEATTKRDGLQFRCKVTDSTGDVVYSGTATLHVQTTEPLAITTQPTDFTGPVGATATFHVAATGTGLTYQWQYKSAKDGKWYNASATGAKTDTMSIEVTNARDGLQFRCKVTDSTGDVVYSSTATLHVQTAEPLAITTQPADFTGPVGATATFTVVATGTGLTYQWQYKSLKDGKWYNTTTTGYNTATMSIEVTNARNGMEFRCKVTDGSGDTVYSNAAAIHVGAALAITDQPTDFTGPIGATATFTVVATGTGLTYQWQYKSLKDGKWYNTTTTGYNTATMSIGVTNARNGMEFRCIVTDASGDTVTSNAAALHVQ